MGFTAGAEVLGDVIGGAAAADVGIGGAADLIVGGLASDASLGAIASGGLGAGLDLGGLGLSAAGGGLGAGALSGLGEGVAASLGAGGLASLGGGAGAALGAGLDISADPIAAAGLSGAGGAAGLTDAALGKGLVAGAGSGLSTPGALGAAGGGPLSTAPGVGLNAAAAGTSALTPAAPTAATGLGGLGSSVGDFLKANKSLILPGALEAGSLLSKPKIPFQGNLQQLAQPSAAGNAAGDLAKNLIPTVQTGNLPPGAQTSVSNAVNDSITSIKAKYAQMGLSGSTMEAQDIASAQARGQAMSFDLANQLTQTGLAAAGVSQQDIANQENIYALLMNSLLQTDAELQQALAGFASASALGAGLGASK